MTNGWDRRPRWLRLLAVLVVPLIGVGGGEPVAFGATGTTAAATGTLTVAPNAAAVGDRVRVSAFGLQPGTVFDVQLCGDGGLDGSLGCDQAGTFTAVTDRSGHFSQYLVVGNPPAPCPCIVQAIAPGLTSTVSTPITITNLPSASPKPAPEPALAGLVVVSSALEGSGPWTSVFGGSAHRTLVLTVRNPNRQRVPVPPLVLTSGPSPAPRDVVAHGAMGTLGAAQSRTYRIGVQFPPLASGVYVVRGRFVASATGLPASTPFVATTHLWPWGLWVLPLVLVLACLAVLVSWWVRTVVRRRRGRPGEPGPAVSAPPTDDPEPKVPYLGAPVYQWPSSRPGAARAFRLTARTRRRVRVCELERCRLRCPAAPLSSDETTRGGKLQSD